LLSRIFTAFESRDFRIMWIGACTSSIGTWMQKLAQSWLVLQLSNDPRILGLDTFLGETPIFLFALIAGVVADRFDRRLLLIGSQCLQMASAFLLAYLFATGQAQIWEILTLSFVVGTAQAFGAPAYQSLLPSLVPREHLPNAIAMNSIQFNLARLIGPAVGGLALTSLGAAWCFGLNGVSYLAVIGTLMLVSPNFVPARTTERVLDSMKGGVAFMRKDRNIVSLIFVSFACTYLGIPIVTFLPVFAKDVFLGDAATYTLLLSVEAAGAITGALLVAARGKRANVGRDALVGMVSLGVFMLAFSLSQPLWLSCVFLFFGGMSLIACFSLFSSLVQFMATDEMRGRVMSIYNIAFRGGMPIGSLVTGLLIPHFGAPAVVAAHGVLLVFLGLYLLLVHRRLATA
jgi:MFS family permease